MTYIPNLGRWLQADPTGFGGGDVNLYRTDGDNPVDRTDPSGEWYITSEPDTFLKKLKDAGANDPRAYKLPSGYYYIHTTDRDAQSIFKIADEWFSQVFNEKLYESERRIWEQAAKNRNAFIFAGGAAGSYLRGSTFVDPSKNCEKVKLSQEDIQAIRAIVIEKLEEPRQKHFPLIVDVGGEGRNTKVDDTLVLNLNAIPYQHVKGNPPVLNYIYGDGLSLPFRNGTVDYLYYENMFANQRFVNELVRVAAPGGTIRVYGATEGVRILKGMFKNAGSNIDFSGLGDYLNTGIGDGFDAKIPKE